MTTTTHPDLRPYFARKVRTSDAETITVLTDDAPEWLRDAVHECHDGLLPDDWTYEACQSIADHLAEDWTDESYEIADALTEFRTWHLIEWSKSHTDAVDQALADYFGGATPSYDAVDQALADYFGGATPSYDDVLMAAQRDVLAYMVDVIRTAADANDDG